MSDRTSKQIAMRAGSWFDRKDLTLEQREAEVAALIEGEFKRRADEKSDDEAAKLRALLKRAQRFLYAGPPRNADHDSESALSAEILAALAGSPLEATDDAADAARYRWLRNNNAYAPEEDSVRGGIELDILCDRERNRLSEETSAPCRPGGGLLPGEHDFTVNNECGRCGERGPHVPHVHEWTDHSYCLICKEPYGNEPSIACQTCNDSQWVTDTEGVRWPCYECRPQRPFFDNNR